jgi:hypothetical protein
MTKKPLERRIYKNAPIIEATSGKMTPHTYIDPLPEYDYECLPPKETYKVKIRIANITNGKPSIYFK